MDLCDDDILNKYLRHSRKYKKRFRLIGARLMTGANGSNNELRTCNQNTCLVIQ